MKLTMILAAVWLLLIPTAAHAQWEVEADPIAYALGGFSVHGARELPGGRERLQVGVFGADVPAAWLANEAFTENSRGVTVKFDYFLRDRPAGLFVGADGDYSRERYGLKRTGESTGRNLFGLGPRVGYRFDIGRHFYVTPWFSAAYEFNVQDDVVLSGERYDQQQKYSLFATVHAGWRF
jgi:hypothetical protein